ncbi:MAG: response regulator [Rubrivivax sp.]|nr:MAG: response regulator [Rubrivivax sp.]
MNQMMLVDDEPHVLSALKRVVRTHFGATVKLETFTDPSQALMRVREKAFDVVVSDYRMPQMTGTAFLAGVRDCQPQAVRMILSASTEVEVVMKAVNELEVFRYLSKPWQEDDLVQQLQAALARATEGAKERALADMARVSMGEMSPAERERRLLEEQEPGLTHVEWGPQGEVIMPSLDADLKAY